MEGEREKRIAENKPGWREEKGGAKGREEGEIDFFLMVFFSYLPM
jgi:hypothetical protein